MSTAPNRTYPARAASFLSRTLTDARIRMGTILLNSGEFDYWSRCSDRGHAERTEPFNDEWRGAAQLAFLKSIGLQTRHRFLDYGCASLSTALAVIPYLNPSNYVGIDVGRQVCARGVRRLTSHGIARATYHVLNASSPNLPELEGFEFDFVFSFSVFQYLSRSNLQTVMRRIAGLTDGTICLTFSEGNVPRGMHRHSLDDYKALLPGFTCEIANLEWPDDRPSQTGPTTAMAVFRKS